MRPSSRKVLGRRPSSIGGAQRGIEVGEKVAGLDPTEGESGLGPRPMLVVGSHLRGERRRVG